MRKIPVIFFILFLISFSYSADLGDMADDATIHFMWTTNDSNGEAITRSTNGTISVYKDNGITQSVAGITDIEDFDGITGLHACTIDLSSDAFYSVGSNYVVTLTGAVVDTRSVTAALATFSIENRFMRGTDYVPGHTGAVFYVDATSGNDSNDGLSFSAAKLTITAGIAAASAGDMVRVGAGTYTDSDIEIPIGKDGLQLIGGTGRVMSGSSITTTAILVAANDCLVSGFSISSLGGLKNAVIVTGKRNRIESVVCVGPSTGFSAIGRENVFDKCIAFNSLVVGFLIDDDKQSLFDCQAVSDTSTDSTGFLIAMADASILINCHSSGHRIVGFQIDAGSRHNVIAHCSSGPGDGARIDNGTDNSWPDFRITEVAVSDAQILADLTDIKGTDYTSATHSLVAIIARGNEAWVTGSTGGGAEVSTYTLTYLSAPTADCIVEVYTESAKLNKTASGVTNNFGQIVFYLDTGTYYLWRKKSGWNFTNPLEVTVGSGGFQ